MRPAICAAMLLFTAPVLAANAAPTAPPSPPPVTYQVWGFKWDGCQYVKQAAYCFSTSDIEQAAKYADQLMSYGGWSATTNMPASCVDHTVFHDPTLTRVRPSAFPDRPTYDVWAFRLQDGQWVKDDTDSWRTTDPIRGLDYVKKVNAVAGWRATDNCPEPAPIAQRYVDAGTRHGAENYNDARFRNCDTLEGPGGWIAYWQQMFPGIDWNANSNAPSQGMDNTFTYDNSSDVQNMINTQDMINTQNMLNNIQDMVNTQNMINTQNMVNNIQDMVNTQNMVDTQNMINSMQSAP